MATRMQQRRGTAAEWTSADPILGSGEIGFETDTNKFKIGDGTTVWSSLTYFTSIDQIVDGSPETLDTLNEIAAAINDDPDVFNTLISRTLDDLPDVTITTPSDNDVLYYNATAGEWINQPGIPLDANLDIPLSYLTELSDDVDIRIAGFGTTTVQTEAEWTADASIPTLGSLNISTGASVRAKIGDGINVFDSLDYVPNNSYVAAEIATALADYATKDSPTFSGTVSLPSTTSIGDVDATEIGYLDGVTSGIQGQLDTKAPTADPTFTGTVSGITKSMVGLGNVDNTADADKPVSTATQTALDAKADLAGATFTGDVSVDTNLTVDGNLTVNGTTFNASSTSIVIEDNMVQLAHQNSANTVDLGLVVAYNDGSANHAGIVRDVSDDTWKLFKGVSTEPATTVAFGEGSLDDLAVNNLTAAGVVFADGTQTKAGVPSLTSFTQVEDTVQTATITGATGDGSAVTFTTAADHGFSEGDSVVVADVDSSFFNGTYIIATVPSTTTFTVASGEQEAFVSGGTATATTPGDYTLDTLDHQDNIIEMNSSVGATFTIPTNAALAWPVGASMDIFASGTGAITIAGDAGVTVNATPGLTLRTQWSSATILKRGTDSWVVYGDLKA